MITSVLAKTITRIIKEGEVGVARYKLLKLVSTLSVLRRVYRTRWYLYVKEGMFVSMVL